MSSLLGFSRNAVVLNMQKLGCVQLGRNGPYIQHDNTVSSLRYRQFLSGRKKGYSDCNAHRLFLVVFECLFMYETSSLIK